MVIIETVRRFLRTQRPLSNRTMGVVNIRRYSSNNVFEGTVSSTTAVL